MPLFPRFTCHASRSSSLFSAFNPLDLLSLREGLLVIGRFIRHLIGHPLRAPGNPVTFVTLATLSILCFTAFGALAADAERSVIQITAFIQQPVWDAPWRFEAVHRAGGTGFIIKGKRIMTNAHVVSWAKQVIVHRYQDPRPYLAEIEFVAHDCDLAILSVEDSSFFDNLEPLEFGELPKAVSYTHQTLPTNREV